MRYGMAPGIKCDNSYRSKQVANPVMHLRQDQHIKLYMTSRNEGLAKFSVYVYKK